MVGVGGVVFYFLFFISPSPRKSDILFSLFMSGRHARQRCWASIASCIPSSACIKRSHPTVNMRVTAAL